MGDDKIVPFRPVVKTREVKPEELAHLSDQVWQCRCGNQTWYLLKGGEVECKRCGNYTHLRTFSPNELPPRSA